MSCEDKGKEKGRPIPENVLVKTAETQGRTSKNIASDVDALFEDTSETITPTTTNLDTKPNYAASDKVADRESDAHAQAVADLKAEADQKQRLPPASTYKEQAHVLTEQEKRARNVKNNTDDLKADKAWMQRYMKKHGKVGAVPPDDAALNAEREKHCLKW